MTHSTVPLPGGKKVKACTMFGGHLFVVTESGEFFMLDEDGEWQRIKLTPAQIKEHD